MQIPSKKFLDYKDVEKWVDRLENSNTVAWKDTQTSEVEIWNSGRDCVSTEPFQFKKAKARGKKGRDTGEGGGLLVTSIGLLEK